MAVASAGHMQVCTSLQTDNHTSTSPLSFLQAGCPSCRPTNSVKALKARIFYELRVITFPIDYQLKIRLGNRAHRFQHASIMLKRLVSNFYPKMHLDDYLRCCCGRSKNRLTIILRCRCTFSAQHQRKHADVSKEMFHGITADISHCNTQQISV